MTGLDLLSRDDTVRSIKNPDMGKASMPSLR